MKKFLINLLILASLILFPVICIAESMYPSTLDNGNLVLVDAHMGVGDYAIRDSVSVIKYQPPNYELSIDVVGVSFSEDYFKIHKNYKYSPYKIGSKNTVYIRYNWNRRSVSRLRNGIWVDYIINRDNCHADGNPFVPNVAEVAFVSAYNMRFFDNMLWYSPSLHEYYRVINEDFYRILNI